MSDSLRIRIAKVLYEDGQRPMATAARLADSVIRELGLRPELGQRSKPTGPLWGANNRYNVTRYVTEWENNDE